MERNGREKTKYKTKRNKCVTQKLEVIKTYWKKIQHLVWWFLAFSPGESVSSGEGAENHPNLEKMLKSIFCVCVFFFFPLSAAHVKHSIKSNLCILYKWKQLNEAGYYVLV